MIKLLAHQFSSWSSAEWSLNRAQYSNTHDYSSNHWGCNEPIYSWQQNRISQWSQYFGAFQYLSRNCAGYYLSSFATESPRDNLVCLFRIELFTTWDLTRKIIFDNKHHYIASNIAYDFGGTVLHFLFHWKSQPYWLKPRYNFKTLFLNTFVSNSIKRDLCCLKRDFFLISRGWS